MKPQLTEGGEWVLAYMSKQDVNVMTEDDHKVWIALCVVKGWSTERTDSETLNLCMDNGFVVFA